MRSKTVDRNLRICSGTTVLLVPKLLSGDEEPYLRLSIGYQKISKRITEKIHVVELWNTFPLGMLYKLKKDLLKAFHGSSKSLTFKYNGMGKPVQLYPFFRNRPLKQFSKYALTISLKGYSDEARRKSGFAYALHESIVKENKFRNNNNDI